MTVPPVSIVWLYLQNRIVLSDFTSSTLHWCKDCEKNHQTCSSNVSIYFHVSLRLNSVLYLARWSCSQSIKCIRCIAPNMRITCTPGLDYERHSKGEHFIGKTLQWFKVSEPTLHCVLTSHTDKLISGVWYLVAFLSVSIFRLKKKIQVETNWPRFMSQAWKGGDQ